jgi:hypothetical protein
MKGSVAQFEALSGHLRGKSRENQKISHYKQDRGRVGGMATRIRYRRIGIRIQVGTRYFLPSKRPILPLGLIQPTVWSYTPVTPTSL